MGFMRLFYVLSIIGFCFYTVSCHQQKKESTQPLDSGEREYDGKPSDSSENSLSHTEEKKDDLNILAVNNTKKAGGTTAAIKTKTVPGKTGGYYYGESHKILKKDLKLIAKLKKIWGKSKFPQYSRPLSKLAYSLEKFGGKSVSSDSLLKLAANFGIATPWISQSYLIATGYDCAFFARWLKTTLMNLSNLGKLSHFGVAIFKGSKSGEKVAVILLQKRKITLDKFKSWVKTGEKLRISGKVTKDIKKIDILMTKPDNSIVRKKIPFVSGKIFAYKHKFCSNQKDRGLYRIELMGVDAGGPVVLALFPIACGSFSYLKKVSAKLKKPAVDIKASLFSAQVFTLINKYRVSRKLKPLKLHKKLSFVAQYHSNEMCKLGKIFHVSPTTGNPAKRVKKFGLTPTLIAENVAVASSPEAVVQSWILSEGHRVNLLLKKADKAGIGICKGTISNTIVYYATYMAATGLK